MDNLNLHPGGPADKQNPQLVPDGYRRLEIGETIKRADWAVDKAADQIKGFAVVGIETDCAGYAVKPTDRNHYYRRITIGEG